MVRGLTIRKSYTFPLCIYFHQYINLGERNESVSINAEYLIIVIMYEGTTQRWYFLVVEFMECSLWDV